MKESISYTFLLNIVIIFIFVCFAIIMGIFSYHRAFKANIMIINAIEKYEGYNCLSKNEINQKLSTIAYNVPFDLECSRTKHGQSCIADENNNYIITAYNLNHSELEATNMAHRVLTHETSYGYFRDDNMNSEYVCYTNRGVKECMSTDKYQYGVYTYMYVDLPVINKLLKINVYGKTREMYEFRDLRKSTAQLTPTSEVVDVEYDANYILDKFDRNDIEGMAKQLFSYDIRQVMGNTDGRAPADHGLRATDDKFARTYYQELPDASMALNGYNYYCGYVRDYSQF